MINILQQQNLAAQPPPAPAPNCEWCEQPFVRPPRKPRQRFCAHRCRLDWLHSLPSRRRANRVLGRYLTPKGYVRGEVWRDGRRVKVYEHRWVVEQHLGRPLHPRESVHHINGDPTDNRIENLRLYPSVSAHLRAEHATRPPRKPPPLRRGPRPAAAKAEIT
jgi:hypothetical protein